MRQRSSSSALGLRTKVSSISSLTAVSLGAKPVLQSKLGADESAILEEDFTKRVTGMVNFISGNRLKAVSDHGFFQHGQSLSKWYRANSVNFVANNHLVWDIDGSKKPSKRFGNLIRSPVNGLNDMLGQHQEEVQGFITRRVVRRDDETEEEEKLVR